MMARSSEVNIDIQGKSVHAASYGDGIDALEIACRYLCDLYAMERAIDPAQYRLLRFGVLHGRYHPQRRQRSCLPGRDVARLSGSGLFDMKNELTHIAERYAPAVFPFRSVRLSAVINDPALFQQAKDLLPQLICLEGPS